VAKTKLYHMGIRGKVSRGQDRVSAHLLTGL
jgi:hypothetical protein